jgi:hypothetical protein
MVAFYLVSEKGDLEIKSVLLVMSLRKIFDNKISSVNILVPNDQLATLSSLHFLKKLGCRIIPFKNSLIAQAIPKNLSGNRVSNKIFFLEDTHHQSVRMIFLDSDMLLLRPFDLESLLVTEHFCAKQADRANVTRWDEIYKLFNLSMPNTTAACTVDGIRIPPYFNAGFISINPLVRAELFEVWKEFFIKLSDPQNLSKSLYQPFNRDQVSLALAVNTLNIDVNFLPEKFNFPIRSKQLPADTIFAHYHDPLTIRNNNELLTIYREFYNVNSDFKVLANKYWQWSWVFKSKATRFLATNRSVKRFLSRFNHVK